MITRWVISHGRNHFDGNIGTKAAGIRIIKMLSFAFRQAPRILALCMGIFGGFESRESTTQ